ncbi:MAG TPA: DUF6089 family protein [Chitinophagaceae bacterium]|nr:DUF6089 family protein [Chitinophagaceae bacterium]
MRGFITAIAIFCFCSAFSQPFQIGLFGGISNYQGDLVDKIYAGRFTKPAIGLTLNYELSERFNIRAGFTQTRVEGDDKYNTKTYLQSRNLNFQSSISEFSLLAEFNFFNLSNMKWTPYAFGGFAVYHFNPYTHDASGIKYFLKPLSTEGQGIAGYNAQPYSLTQLALPIGGGVKYAISDKVRLGVEVGFRKLFTDYLDDLSTNYVDQFDLLLAKGPKAVELSYRGDEVPGGDPGYPAKGAQRGGVSEKDAYYFTGLHLSFRLGSGNGGGLFNKRGKNGFGCPTVPQ